MIRTKRLAFSHATLAIALLIVGCGSGGGAPSASFIEQAIMAKGQEVTLKKDNRPVLEIQDVTKIDGFMSGDGKKYTADFTSSIKLNMCAYRTSKSEVYNRYASGGICNGTRPGETKKSRYGTLYGEGYVLQLKGQANFIKKESGWSLSRLAEKSD